MTLRVSRATLADLPDVIALMKPAWVAQLDAEWPAVGGKKRWAAPKLAGLKALLAANDVRTVALVRDDAQANKLVMAEPIYDHGDKYEFGLLIWDTSLTALARGRALRAMMKSVCLYVATHAGPDVPLFGIVRKGSAIDTFFSGFPWLTRTTNDELGDGTMAIFTATASIAGAGF